MVNIPLSLSISCSVLPPSCHAFTILHEGGHTDTILHADAHFRYILSNIQPNRRFSHFVTADVFSQMISITRTFTHLEILSLTNHIISDSFHGLLRCISGLRVLEISSCHLEIESDTSDGGFVASEHLQQLTFCNITFRCQPSFSALVAAPNLSSLSFDCTSGGCFPISELRDTYEKLTTLQVFDVVSWTVEQMSPHDTIAAALAILNRSPTLRNFSTDISLFSPLASSFSVNSPASLGAYRGPVNTLSTMMSCGAFQEIDVLEITGGQINLDSLCSFIPHSTQDFQQPAVSTEILDISLSGAPVQLANLRTLTHIFFHVENFTLVCDSFTTRSLKLMDW